MHGKKPVTSISIMISQPAPAKPRYEKESLKDKVDRMIRAVESNQIDSEYEWKCLKYLYECLSRKPRLSDAQIDILEQLEDLMEKYANHDAVDSVDLDAQYMWRGDD